MPYPIPERAPERDPQEFALRLTPAEWRRMLEAHDFLKGEHNSYRPRRLLGVVVEIVPDHSFG
ncbi:hypothetical protein [Phenylobacterium sp.]|uniref:hypothetical protein n=1 Tax=Phenylobacterium sp. TaxID=1871053 RepID=UPI002732C1AD|nr:hypothetical protein [Phenylobacterium sp.]MDP3660611.1 hypothetical protein [Phenylobacterium sp.]